MMMSFERVVGLVLSTLTRALLFGLLVPKFYKVMEEHSFRFISLLFVILASSLCRIVDEHSATLGTGIFHIFRLYGNNF